MLEHAVIVDLAIGWRPEAELTAEEAAAQRTRIDEAERAVLVALGDHGRRQRQLHATGQISLLVDATGLEILRGHPDVGAIHQDRDDPPTG